MCKQISKYEVVPHGSEEFPVELYSKTIDCINYHYHKEYEIFWLSEGEMLFGIENEEYIISTENVIFIEPNTPHYAYDIDEKPHRHFFSIVFDVSAFGQNDDPCKKMLESIRINRFLKIPEHMLSDAEKLYNKMKSGEFGAEMAIKSFLFNIITYIVQSEQYMKYSDPKLNRPHSSTVIDTAISYIKAHYREKISFDSVFYGVSYSKSHMRRLFKEKTGLSFVDYVNKYRVEKSCLELIYSEKSIADIAVDNGFNNIQYYSKIFKMFMKQTPKQYRQTAKFFHKMA